jgi:hypothetical protein
MRIEWSVKGLTQSFVAMRYRFLGANIEPLISLSVIYLALWFAKPGLPSAEKSVNSPVSQEIPKYNGDKYRDFTGRKVRLCL